MSIRGLNRNKKGLRCVGNVHGGGGGVYVCVCVGSRESDEEGVTPRNKTFLHRRAMYCAAESELGVFNRHYPW